MTTETGVAVLRLVLGDQLSDDLSALGVVERVISEKDGFAAVNTEMKSALEETIARLQACDTDELLQNRYEKFRRIGRPEV